MSDNSLRDVSWKYQRADETSELHTGNIERIRLSELEAGDDGASNREQTLLNSEPKDANVERPPKRIDDDFSSHPSATPPLLQVLLRRLELIPSSEVNKILRELNSMKKENADIKLKLSAVEDERDGLSKALSESRSEVEQLKKECSVSTARRETAVKRIARGIQIAIRILVMPPLFLLAVKVFPWLCELIVLVSPNLQIGNLDGVGAVVGLLVTLGGALFTFRRGPGRAILTCAKALVSLFESPTPTEGEDSAPGE